MTVVVSLCLFAGPEKFKLTYAVPAGFEVKSVTLVFMPGELLHVVAVNAKTGEALLLVYDPNKAEPIAVVKFKQQ